MRIVLVLISLCFFIKPAFSADKALYNEVYREIPSLYITPIDVDFIGLKVLQSLKNVDKNLTVANDVRRVSLYHKSKLKKSYLKPLNKNDVEAWSELTSKVVDDALNVSTVAQKKEFEINDIILSSALPMIDKYSKYYTDIDFTNKRIKHKRTFASKMIGDILYINTKAVNPVFSSNIQKSIDNNLSAKAMIIDLRGNSGGSLGEAIKAADIFLDGGIIVAVLGKKGGENIFYQAKEDVSFKGKPIVALVDAGTASSAEVFVTALQEQGRAVVMGTITTGKATVQEVKALSNDAYIAITSAYFTTPSGKNINSIGVLPDICLNLVHGVGYSDCAVGKYSKNVSDIDEAIKHINTIMLK